jgi:glucuronate isomerase
MKKFLDENFILQSATAQKLYHDFAKQMPVIDYHNHLPPDQIANDINFENLTQMAVWRPLQMESHAYLWC